MVRTMLANSSNMQPDVRFNEAVGERQAKLAKSSFLIYCCGLVHRVKSGVLSAGLRKFFIVGRLVNHGGRNVY